MDHNLKPYPAYKDSGVPWLGEIPAHWEIKRQRNIVDMLVSNVDKLSVDGEAPVRLCNYVDVYKNDHITERIQFMRATASATEIDRFRLRLGDVLITKDSESWNDIGVPSLVEYVAEDLICGYHLALLRPRPNILIGSFLLRAIQSRGVSIQYHIAANGVTRYGLSQDAIKSVLVPIPSLEEQHHIAAFLDHIDRRVNRFIRIKRRMIALLNEQKQAIIHRAVTRGLDPDVRLKPSGVEWMGEVPEHWEIWQIGY
ncbi:MAG: restriction endonuclease subunit S, partial [Chloroflexia bacterium]|nr:restriction endonuclease subunit S [Chloroflexia bacterium]